ncbi:membrane protein insertase YidC [Candidatus Berkelbacteria bacterium]|nr:membrane protein insertase YidC [Candidatus Berkelbacteria bacterium]
MITSIKSFLTAILYAPLFNLLFLLIHWLPGESLALGIISLTALVRLLLLPVSAQAVRSQKETQAIQPEIDKLNEKFKDDPQEKQKQLLQLYQDHNINPFKSCLPLLIQLPILLILYRVFIKGIQHTDFSLLYSFVPQPQFLNTTLFGINLEESSLILALIAGAFQFIQTWQIQRRQKAHLPKSDKPAQEIDPTKAAQQVSNKLAYIMPVFTIFIAMTLPSALAIYWIITTVFAIAQQFVIFRTHPEVAQPHVAVSIKRPQEK